MLQFLADNIDQLDLALDQLALQDRNFDRFALMLVDNVVELTLHRYAQDRAIENEYGGNPQEPKNDPKLVKKALQQSFEKKVKAARDLGLYDSQLCDSFLKLHGFRNTVYHQGLRHEGILHSLAIFYFTNACDLLSNYQPRFWGWSSHDVYSYRARKYIGDIMMCDHKAVFHNAYARLREVAESLNSDLVADLAQNMEATIEEADEMISFLARNTTEQNDRNQVIINVQARPFAFTKEAKEFARDNGYSEEKVGAPYYVDWIAQNVKWQVASDPIESWNNRVIALRQQSDPHAALQRYCDFMSQTKELRSQVDEAAAQLDMYIQQEVNRVRGK